MNFIAAQFKNRKRNYNAGKQIRNTLIMSGNKVRKITGKAKTTDHLLT
jgi:hypothetical protein